MSWGLGCFAAVHVFIAVALLLPSCTATKSDREILAGQCEDGKRGVRFVLHERTIVLGYCKGGDLVKVKEWE